MDRFSFPTRPRGRGPYRAALAVLTLLLAVILAIGGDGALVASAASRPKDDPARTTRDKGDSETERQEDPASTGRDNSDQQREPDRDPAAGIEDEDASQKERKRKDDTEAEAADKGDVEALAAKTFTNSSRIFMPNNGTALLYPSEIRVSGFQTSILDVNVTLHNFSHGVADDVDVLLVGPQSQTAVIMSDVGGGDVTNLTLALNDEASQPMPDAVPPFPDNTTRSFKPTDGTGQGTEAFPAPAPPEGGNSALSVFDGTNPNGVWRLFVVDDLVDFSGEFEGGWSLRIATENGPPQASPDRFKAKAGKTLRRAAPGVLANDSDPDGPITAALVKRTRHGTVRLQADGSFTYRSEKNFSGKDSFVYEARDGLGLTDNAKVTIKVKGRRR